MQDKPLIFAQDLDERETYKLLTGLIVPRPIAWVSTIDIEGHTNLAPFSFFNAASIVPPMVIIAIEPRGIESKDTLANIELTGEFVVNLVVEKLIKSVVSSALEFSANESEFDKADVTEAQSSLVRPPRVAESPVSMECRLERTIALGFGPHTLVVGEILAWQIAPEILDRRDRVDFAALQPVGRMAGDKYVRCTDLVSETRLDQRGSDYE